MVDGVDKGRPVAVSWVRLKRDGTLVDEGYRYSAAGFFEAYPRRGPDVTLAQVERWEAMRDERWPGARPEAPAPTGGEP